MSSEYWKILVGQIIESVVFVQDYLQIKTTTGSITFVAMPVLIRQGISRTSNDSSYADELCEEIGRKIVVCEFVADEVFLIATDDAIVRQSLRQEDRIDVEMIIYFDRDPKHWWVL